MFEPLSRVATQIAMGPWYRLDSARPFMPGLSYATLLAQARGGKVTAETILRGPTTRQFWARARSVPGVSHLLGICHACGQAVAPGSAHCAHCQTEFPAPVERNRLGLAADPAQAMLGQRQLDPTLCPCCGQETGEVPGCGTCGVLFAADPGERFAAPGPWRIRDETRIFDLGLAHGQLQYLVAIGRVRSDTILRGPSTHQFWAPAREAPGVAQWFGWCHACRAEVDPEASRCPSCQKSFAPAVSDDELGLMYPTESDVEAAARQLAEAQRLVDAASSIPGTPAAAGTTPAAAARGTEQPSRVAQDGEIYVSDLAADLDRIEQQQAHVADEIAEQAVAEEPALDLAEAAGNLVGGALHQHAVRERRARRKAPVGLLISSYVVLGLVILLFIFRPEAVFNPSGKPPPDQPPERPAVATPEQRSRAEAVQADLIRVEKLKHASQFETQISAARRQWDQIMESWDAQDFPAAMVEVESLATRLGEIETLHRDYEARIAMRGGALAARHECEVLAAAVESAGGPRLAQAAWNEAQVLLAQGQQQFDQEQFPAAQRTWQSALAAYGRTQQWVKKAETSAKALEQLNTELTSSFSMEQVQTLGGPTWQKIAGLRSDGEKEHDAQRYELALQKYETARRLVPGLQEHIQRIVGAKFWAFRCGYLASDLLFDYAAKREIEPAKPLALRQAFENLQLSGSFLSSLPTGVSIGYREAARILLTDAPKAVETVRDQVLADSYRVGVQWRIVQRLLQAHGTYITPLERQELDKSIFLVERDARGAGYDEAFFTFLGEVKAQLRKKPQYLAIKKSREHWAKMTKKLEGYSTARSIIK
ncbi:MAG: hypothetical protein OER86_04920 [Phycisphaerae bacterium]|nr:hypothetical protein [Phycisphaerae bacterium]